MYWSAYLVLFRLLSPLHAGWRKVGNLQQTRTYLPGRNLRGALAARLTRDFGEKRDYQETEEKIDELLRFTYFYPVAPTDIQNLYSEFTAGTNLKNTELLWPWEDPEKFAWLFLDSYAGTAISDQRTAEEGTLHETEFISHCTKEGKQVGLIGYIFARNDCALPWKEVLSRLQVGGERTYGWGRLALWGREPEKLKVEEGKIKCFGCTVYAGESKDNTYPGGPVFSLEKEQPLLAHAKAETVECRGAIEPVVGRTTKDGAFFGREISMAEICWVPGSKVKQAAKFCLLKEGLWKRTTR
ncbi:MAG: CRISPR-associated protein [Peptococcaceae bacterium]|nr:MAG: CRISPR-associated protein [Peptococcaceae bacterium]